MNESANVVLPLARDNLHGLVSILTSIAFNKFESKINRKGAVRAGNSFFIYFEWRYERYYYNQKFVKKFGCIYEVTETVKHEIKNKKVVFLEFC